MRQDQPRLADEMEKMEYEPLLPVEKKLIVWSIALGVVLLVVLTWVSYTFFPGTIGIDLLPQEALKQPDRELLVASGTWRESRSWPPRRNGSWAASSP